MVTTVINGSHQCAATAPPIPYVKMGKKIPLTAAEKRAKKTEKLKMKRQAMSPVAKLVAKKKDSENKSIRLK